MGHLLGHKLDRRAFAKRTVNTDSAAIAAQQAEDVNRATEAYWGNLLGSQSDDTVTQHEAAVGLTQSARFEYRPVNPLLDSDLSDLVSRLKALDGGPSKPKADGLLGLIDKAMLHLSEAMETYFRISRDQTVHKSERELRRWKNPRLKALQNFQEVGGGDPALADTSRDMTLRFRD